MKRKSSLCFMRFKQWHSCANTMRSQFVNFLKSIRKLDVHRSDIDRKIVDSVLSTKKFIKDNPNIIFTRADKGNTVVALDRSEYGKRPDYGTVYPYYETFQKKIEF